MKYIFLLLIIFATQSLANVWSSLKMSGFELQYEILNQFIETQNKELQNIWENEIATIINEIDKETQLQKILYKKLQKINEELLITKKEKEFLLQQELHLLDNNTNIESINDTTN